MDKGDYYQISDEVAPKIVKAITKECEGDCMVSARICKTTCMGMSTWYNKKGVLQVHDSNRFTALVTCSKCWKSEYVNQDGEIVEE